MGEKLGQLGLGSDVRELKIGSSFTRDSSSSIHTIRYDFKPASVDPSKMGSLQVADSNSSVSVTVPHMNGTGVTHFGGHAKEANKRECILIYDRETGAFTLEKISSQILLKKTRPEKPLPPEPKPLLNPSHHHHHSNPPPPPPPPLPHIQKKHSKPHTISPTHRTASPVPPRPKPPPAAGASAPHPPVRHNNHHHHYNNANYQRQPDPNELPSMPFDMDDELDIIKPLQSDKSSPPRPKAQSASSPFGQPPSQNNYEKAPHQQSSTGEDDESESSSSDSSSGSDSDSDDEDFQEVVQSKSNVSAAPSVPSFSTSPTPRAKATPPAASASAFLSDDLQLSSESDDDSD